MATFFLLLELSMYILIVYLFLQKKELSIIYLPVLFFIDTVIATHVITAFVYYGAITFLLFNLIGKNLTFLKRNVFSLFLFVYFLILLSKSRNIDAIRQDVFNVSWLFLLIPLIPSIYKKYSRDIILKELAQSAFLILVIFILNVLMCTRYAFNPYLMYGITGGIMYGNMYATDFNVLAVAVFIVLYRAMQTKNFIYMAVFVVAMVFIGLSLRRSVTILSLAGTGLAMFLTLGKSLKRVIVFGGLIGVMGLFVAIKTDFASSFSERYEQRNLDERSLDEEKRIFEYGLIYDDMFRYKRYSALFGYELFNSAGNYGNGQFYDRSLHGDLSSVAHSSGIIGVIGYLLMIITAFYQAYRFANTRTDKVMLFYCIGIFITFTAIGRYTQVGNMEILFLTAFLPLCKKEKAEEVAESSHSLALAAAV
jgi:O-antigen ligase